MAIIITAGVILLINQSVLRLKSFRFGVSSKPIY